MMDEFALFKGHRYASVVLDADTRRVLWAVKAAAEQWSGLSSSNWGKRVALE